MRKRIGAGHRTLEGDDLRQSEHGVLRVRQLRPARFVPEQPYVKYADEIVYFTDDASVVNSFMTKFDDAWTDTTSYATTRTSRARSTRHYPTSSIDPELNFPPGAGLREPIGRPLQRRDAEDRRGRCSASPISGTATRSSPPPRAACRSALLADPDDTACRHASGTPGTSTGCTWRGIPFASRSIKVESRQAGPALRSGHVDFRLVELDDAVGELAARAQLLHEERRAFSTGSSTTSSGAGTIRAPADLLKTRSVHAAAARQTGISNAGQHAASASRRPASSSSGTAVRLRTSTTSTSARARRRRCLRRIRILDRTTRPSTPTQYQSFTLPHAGARDNLLLADRLEDDGEP